MNDGIFNRDYNPMLYMATLKAQIGAGVAQNGVANRFYLTALYFPFDCIIDKMSIAVSVAGGAGTKLIIGIYGGGESPTTPKGAKLLGQSVQIAADSIGRKEWTLTSPLKILKGISWGALETADATIQFFKLSETFTLIDTGTAGKDLCGCYYDLGGFGNLTDPCPAITQASNSVGHQVRIVTLGQ